MRKIGRENGKGKGGEAEGMRKRDGMRDETGKGQGRVPKRQGMKEKRERLKGGMRETGRGDGRGRGRGQGM